MESIKDLIREARAEIQKAPTDRALGDTEVKWLGRKGRLTEILRNLKNLSERERKAQGAEANRARIELEALIRDRRIELRSAAAKTELARERIDVTLPGRALRHGRMHPLTRALDEIRGIFEQLGFSAIDGPEIETEWYNFDALNIPADHPARDMWDTFWLRSNQNLKSKNEKGKSGQKLLLRTHTSPVQVRYMEKHAPPYRIIVPGKVYRYEATDASHDVEFHQVEGLMVDRDISVAHFKHVIRHFFERYFGAKKLSVVLRPSFFPFTEPSFEVMVNCIQCDAKRCAVCKRTGWLEVAGAGMVHPNVFKNAGLNPKGLQGFAFGFGVERLAMLKYKIPDIRLFHSSDPRFLKQF
ncbi:MAG: phenylalanine--tRNA ligase subunit alpha [Candidatus Niyogibacteria bacterium]|nr:phenylalanine--tRNA ligase subunit alpha [Candidatus Niyogibacteria bacterium]